MHVSFDRDLSFNDITRLTREVARDELEPMRCDRLVSRDVDGDGVAAISGNVITALAGIIHADPRGGGGHVPELDGIDVLETVRIRHDGDKLNRGQIGRASWRGRGGERVGGG